MPLYPPGAVFSVQPVDGERENVKRRVGDFKGQACEWHLSPTQEGGTRYCRGNWQVWKTDTCTWRREVPGFREHMMSLLHLVLRLCSLPGLG